MAAPVGITVLNRSSYNLELTRFHVCGSGLVERRMRALATMFSAAFSRRNYHSFGSAIDRPRGAVKCAIDKGLVSAMNTFNPEPIRSEEK